MKHFLVKPPWPSVLDTKPGLNKRTSGHGNTHLTPGPVLYETRCKKTGFRGFRPGPTQTGLYSHRRWLEAYNFGFRKKRDCTIRVAKTKSLISCAVTAQLICVFVFAYAKCRFFMTRLIFECSYTFIY